jgi:riboflavin kinase/FMN adenylyltransferase
MQLVIGVDGLREADGPIFAVVGVFDGIHLGHRYLLEALRAAAAERQARPTVITFDHHPDEVLTGTAPPLLLDPGERLARLAECGVEVTVIQHFDESVRRTPYDAFIERIRARTGLAGLLMTPDAAFGFERRGTPGALAELGARDDFDVVIVPPFELDGRSVRSSDVRAAIASGDLMTARELMGRPLVLRGTARRGVLAFTQPLALPPDGAYPCEVDGRPARLEVAGGEARVVGADADDGPIEVRLR